MAGYWVRLAERGNLAGGGPPEWPRFALPQQGYLGFDEETIQEQLSPSKAHRCDIWDAVATERVGPD